MVNSTNTGCMLVVLRLLEEHEFTSDSFRDALRARVEKFPDHKYSAAVHALVEEFEIRSTINIKDIRNIIVAELGSNKPWEVLVGQLIAANISVANDNPHSIQTYLGQKAMKNLFSYEQ